MDKRWLWVALLGAPMMAAAQTPVIEPSLVLNCLTPPPTQRGVPEYPSYSLKLGAAGRVQVELQFSGPDRAPDIKVVQFEGGDAFVDAVKAHVRQFRAPCVTADMPPARVAFDFVFKPDEQRVASRDPTDPDHAEALQQLGCLRHVSGTLQATYPTAARREEIQGRVYAQLQFDAPDQPPVAKVYSSRNKGPLHREIEEWVKGLRLPCQSGKPIRTGFSYVFLLDGLPQYGFKDLTLGKFLGAVRDIRKQRIDFDFTTMGCPFEVRMTYLQPHRPNIVHQLDAYDSSRRPFIDWLKTVEFDVPVPTRDAIYADAITVPIPCAKLNLNPQE